VRSGLNSFEVLVDDERLKELEAELVR